MAEENDPRHHVEKMKARLKEIIDQLRADADKVDDPQFKAMFETSAEAPGGLIKAFNDFEARNESGPEALEIGGRSRAIELSPQRTHSPMILIRTRFRRPPSNSP